jgi:type II secretory pathway pseudopilin PulG
MINEGGKILRPKPLILVVALIAAVGLGWWTGSSNKQKPADNKQTQANSSSAPTSSVKSLVGYTLPDAWQEASCPSSDAVYIIPNGSGGVNCSSNPSAPIKISVDSQNITDCNQLKDVQDVKKHTCLSLYINGHKSLKSLTESTNGAAVSDYYVNTGKGVVKVEYTYNSTNEFQNGFDQLAKSIKVKS